MNQFPTRKEVEQLRERYPKGTRIHLHSMQDPYAKVPSGTKGTVIGVDDAGHIMMHWDSGSTLSLIPGVDSFSKVSAPEKAKQKRSHSWER